MRIYQFCVALDPSMLMAHCNRVCHVTCCCFVLPLLSLLCCCCCCGRCCCLCFVAVVAVIAVVAVAVVVAVAMLPLGLCCPVVLSQPPQANLTQPLASAIQPACRSFFAQVQLQPTLAFVPTSNHFCLTLTFSV